VIRFRTLAEIFSSKACHGWNEPSGIIFSWCLKVGGWTCSPAVLSWAVHRATDSESRRFDSAGAALTLTVLPGIIAADI
jgi:hypothetical protein